MTTSTIATNETPSPGEPSFLAKFPQSPGHWIFAVVEKPARRGPRTPIASLHEKNTTVVERNNDATVRSCPAQQAPNDSNHDAGKIDNDGARRLCS
jgi:hypothetical protein